MAMLDRYRKPGGFIQLLTLLETCGPTKQEKFLEIVRTEDPRWADTIRTKMLDMNRIFSWNQETLAEVIGTLQDLTVAIVLHGANEEVRAKIHATFSHARKRKIDDLFQTSNPSPQEIAAMHIKVLETVRKMGQDGSLRFDKFDPQLAIDQDIEEKLAKGTLASVNADMSVSAATPAETTLSFGQYDTPAASLDNASDPRIVTELQTARKKLAELEKANAILRHELSVAKTKLEQIKKIA